MPTESSLIPMALASAVVASFDGNAEILDLSLLGHGHLSRDTVLGISVADNVLVAVKEGLAIVDCCFDVDTGG